MLNERDGDKGRFTLSEGEEIKDTSNKSYALARYESGIKWTKKKTNVIVKIR